MLSAATCQCHSSCSLTFSRESTHFVNDSNTQSSFPLCNKKSTALFCSTSLSTGLLSRLKIPGRTPPFPRLRTCRELSVCLASEETPGSIVKFSSCSSFVVLRTNLWASESPKPPYPSGIDAKSAENGSPFRPSPRLSNVFWNVKLV